MTEEGRFSKYRPSMNFGIFISVVLIALHLSVWLLKLERFVLFQYINWGVLIGVLYYTLKRHRDENLGGVMSYKKAIGSGVGFFFFASIIYGFYMVIYYTWLDPAAVEQGLDMLEDFYYNQGMSEAQIETAMEAAEMMRSPGMQAFSAVIGTTLLGLILSLLVGAFVKKSGDPFTDAMRQIDTTNSNQ